MLLKLRLNFRKIRNKINNKRKSDYEEGEQRAKKIKKYL